MEDRTRVGAFMLLGAALGGLVGYLFFTAGGRRLRAEIEPHFEDLVDGARQLTGQLEKVRQAAGEGWHSMSRLVGDLPDGAEGWPGSGRPGASHG